MSDRRMDQHSMPRELSESPLFCSPNMDDDSDLELDDANAFELDTDLVKPKSKFDPARSFTLPPGWDDMSDEEEEQGEADKESGEEVEEYGKDDLEVRTPPLNGTPWFSHEKAASILSSIALAEAKPPVIEPIDLGAALARRSESLARDAAAEVSKQGSPKKPEAIQDPDETESECSDSEEEQPWGFAYQGYAWRDDPRAKHLTVEQMQAQMDAEKEDAPLIRRQAENLGDVVRQCKERRERRAARKAAKGKKKEMSRRWAPY
ncbi:hypothetical protein LTS07_002227 [Exophiala sideris]|uniref:Uncharacterized protein n=1 Tax=Exophiala sideris TaxID=1016849 RepID=A0ABR0JLN8_9EURO|nr:hypothetical protein LTS07_002227 [Exophiala sideris]KAK5041671.1 hypothetical protein LTR13_002338 [Exophiala sideris]KAK5066883.1 hypothetical protein LTR69_002231 [Exophiala sideris]KAK5184942.1 hypothetical protein LTR44_002788 [Eurotiomycetes sp. CCFEE 6388]